MSENGRTPEPIRWLPEGKRGQAPYLVLGGLDALSDLAESGIVRAGRGDVPMSMEPPQVQGWIVRRDKYPIRIRSASVWDLPRDPDAALIAADELAAALAEVGMAAKSPADLGMRIALRSLRRGSLAPRWREIARAAVCSGPMLVARTVGDQVEEWDLRRAFLEGLRGPLPVLNTWHTMPGMPWSALRERPGLVSASVYLARSVDVHPLPTWEGGIRVFARGMLCGTWTIEAVRWAEEQLGAEVVAIHDAALCAQRDAGIAEAIEDLPEILQRPAYTRLWGRACALGGWEGTERDLTGAWAWKWTGGARLGLTADPFHRPDIAAWVTSRNLISVSALAKQLLPGELLAAHVDALWIEWDPSRGGQLPPADWSRWRLKGGPAHGRWRGIGSYDFAGFEARMGLPHLERARMAPEERRTAPEFAAALLGRDWTHVWGDPRDSIGEAIPDWSRSAPLDLQAGREVTFTAPAWDRRVWGDSGGVYTLRPEWEEDEIPTRTVRAGEGSLYVP